MRFTIEKVEILKALNSASHAIAPKNVNPVLSNFKLDLNEKGLEITGSGPDISIKSTVPYMIESREVIRGASQGAILINARIFLDAIRKMSGQSISVEVIDEAIAKVGDGKSSFKFPCVKAEEFPDIDFEPRGMALELPCATFAEMVEQSAFAASTKEQRPVLTAVNLEAGNGVLTATATDSARLAQKKIAIDSEANFRCNLPAKVLSDLIRLFETPNSNVQLSVSESRAIFTFGNIVVHSRLVAGDYPVTKAIIPQNFNYTLEINAQELLAAMERVSILSSDREPVVKLSMSEDEVEVSSKSDVNGSANESISTFQYNGERLEVSFNSIFVMDALKALKTTDVSLRFQAEMKPFVVVDPQNETAVELITPMRTY